MSDKGITAINIKKINKSKVYQYIYRNKITSKQQIVQELQMGLSTVSQNLTLLEAEGLIDRSGFFDSTGGRKAHAIRIVPNFRISIGIGILKQMVHITAIDLYGDVLHAETVLLAYENTPAYYEQVTTEIKTFLTDHHYLPEQILGISFATQGLTSPDNTTVTYGAILQNTGMHLESFAKHLPWPCHLEHDSKAAAHLELWNHPELDSALVLLLNRNLGGAVITNHQIHHGTSMHSGSIEHLCIQPDGPLCYCGNHGCLETFCSANALEERSGRSIKEFFQELRENNDPLLLRIWEEYLDHLAFAIRNATMLLDVPVIISGYLAPYLTEKDRGQLLERIQTMPPFALSKEQLLVGIHGQYTPAIGAALFYIEQFLKTI